MKVKSKIYVGNQSNDLINPLCNLIQESQLNVDYEVVLPHQVLHTEFDVKDYISKCDFMIADMSNPTFALGIEMGWADMCRVPIICICQRGTAISSHLVKLGTHLIEYSEYDELIKKLSQFLNKNGK